MHGRRSRVLLAQFARAVREPNEYVKFALSGDDLGVWYVLLSGMAGDEGEYCGGEYLVRVVLPENFPFDPPVFYFMTPNGLYDVGKKVCISVGEFHKDEYRPVLGVSGFCSQLVSGLVGWKQMGEGIALINTSVEDKMKLAAASRSYNAENYGDILRKVEFSFCEYVQKWSQPI